MANKKKKSAKNNVVWSVIDYSILPVLMITATPILIHAIGLENFGVLMLINALVGFGALLNFGFGDTILKFVSQYLSTGQKTQAANVSCVILVLALSSSLLIGSLFYISIPQIIPLLNMEKVELIETTLEYSTLLLIFKLLEAVFLAIIRAALRYDIVGWLSLITKSLNIFTLVWLATHGYQLPTLIFSNIIFVTVNIMGLIFFSRREVGFVRPRDFLKTYTEIKTFAKWSWLQGLAGIAYSNIDRLIIGVSLGPAEVGIYSVCLRLAQLIHQIPAAAAQSLLPRMSIVSLQGENSEKQTQIYSKACSLVTSVSATSSAFSAIFSHQILTFWIGENIADQGALILTVLAVSFGWFTSNSVVIYNTLNGIGRAGLQAAISTTSCLILILSSALLIPAFGLLGAGAARFPDVIYRQAIRIWVGKKILADLPASTTLDFPRSFIFASTVAYILNGLLVSEPPSDAPQNELIILVWASLVAVPTVVLTYFIETFFSYYRKTDV